MLILHHLLTFLTSMTRYDYILLSVSRRLGPEAYDHDLKELLIGGVHLDGGITDPCSKTFLPRNSVGHAGCSEIMKDKVDNMGLSFFLFHDCTSWVFFLIFCCLIVFFLLYLIYWTLDLSLPPTQSTVYVLWIKMNEAVDEYTYMGVMSVSGRHFHVIGHSIAGMVWGGGRHLENRSTRDTLDVTKAGFLRYRWHIDSLLENLA